MLAFVNINFKLFPNRENDKYERFILRSTYRGWYNTIINDVLATSIVEDLNFEYQDYQPVVVYLNGEYWGIHTIREKIDERYIAYLYDIDKDSVDAIFNPYWGLWDPKNGSDPHSNDYENLIAFIELNNSIICGSVIILNLNIY